MNKVSSHGTIGNALQTTRKLPENKPKTNRKAFAAHSCHGVTPIFATGDPL